MQFLPEQIRTETRSEEHLPTDGATDRARGDDQPHDDTDSSKDLNPRKQISSIVSPNFRVLQEPVQILG